MTSVGAITRQGLLWLLVGWICLASGAPARADKLDEGLLDPSWFGGGIEFRKTDDIDYLWIKPGFSLQGKTVLVEAWSDPQFLGKKRDAKDSAKAVELTDKMPAWLRGGFSGGLEGIATFSKDDGDLVLSGRFVDCNAGSKAAKWLVGMGAGSAAATWDLKFTEKASGEVVLALHHRAISGTTMSEIDDKVIKWIEKFTEAVKDRFRDYEKAKPAKR